MNLERVRGYFNEEATVEHYVRAVANIGLWESEKRLFDKYFDKNSSLLDLGCGAGRVSIGLVREGYARVQGADYAESMVAKAREIAGCLDLKTAFTREDATGLSFADESFEGVIFAFNGIMQIPRRALRRQAMSEIHRVLRKGGRFIFTSLDREDRLYSRVFADQGDFEHDLDRNENLLEYGDRHFETEHGVTFMHVPLRRDVEADLRGAGFKVLESAMRSEIARESEQTLAFSEDCRMWVAEKGMDRG